MFFIKYLWSISPSKNWWSQYFLGAKQMPLMLPAQVDQHYRVFLLEWTNLYNRLAKQIYLNCLQFVSCISLVSCHLQQNKLWHSVPFWESVQPIVQLCNSLLQTPKRNFNCIKSIYNCGQKRLSLMLFVVVNNTWHGFLKWNCTVTKLFLSQN